MSRRRINVCVCVCLKGGEGFWKYGVKIAPNYRWRVEQKYGRIYYVKLGKKKIGTRYGRGYLTVVW